MKKKVIISVIAAVLCVALLICSTALADDGYSDIPGPSNSENLSVTQLENIEDSKGKSSAMKATDSDTDSAWRSSSKTDYLILTFKEPQSFNTAVIREKGWNIKSFYLSYYVDEPGNEHWEMFYGSDSVDDYRYCAFDTVTAKQVKFEVTASDSVFKIREFELYNVEKKARDTFRVSDYVVTPQLASGEIFDPNSSNYLPPEYCDVVNQIHVIASAKWNNDGELVIPDGNSGEELKASVQRLRDFYGERDVEIFATVFFNACDPDLVMTEKNEEVIANTVDFLLEYGFDGVSYDWEYPNKEQWARFSDHIVNLKNELSKYDLKISCAVSPWNFYMRGDAISALDQIEIMSYDLFDENGNHSSFSSGSLQPVQYFLEKGFKPEQINLGLPFYARPEDGGGIWINYDDPAYTPADRFQNYSDGMWFSGTQMTYDKTSYAIQNDLGGMMIFTATEDIPYSEDNSLLKAIRSAVNDRTTLTEQGGVENEIQ